MTKQDLETGIKLLDQVKQMEDIIKRVEIARIKEIVLADGTTSTTCPVAMSKTPSSKTAGRKLKNAISELPNSEKARNLAI